MRPEYADVSSNQEIPLFVDSSPGWTDANNRNVENISTDISAGMQEYIFGRTFGPSDFGIGSGIVADSNHVLLTGAGNLKIKKKMKSPVKKMKSPVKKMKSPVKKMKSPVKKMKSPVKKMKMKSPVKKMKMKSPVKKMKMKSPVKKMKMKLPVKKTVKKTKKSTVSSKK